MMSLKRWVVKGTDLAAAKQLAIDCETDSFTALLGLNRGLDEPYLLDEFLSDEPNLDDPYQLLDMDIAVEHIHAAIDSLKKITVFGDYDCDGVTSTALLYTHLKNMGATVDYYIPDRLEEGYGMNFDAVRRIAERGTELIITVDNGINAGEEISLANELGCDVIVTDHHLPQGTLPEALAVVDPHRPDESGEYTYLSGVGVAFKLVMALSPEISPEALLNNYSQIVTLGLIGDVVPLIGENRMVCKNGLEQINSAPIPGLAALKSIAGVGDKTLTATGLSFQLVPRINAAGRMGKSEIALELLICEDDTVAEEKASLLDKMNTERQQVCDKIFREVSDKIDREKLYNNRIITVWGEGWHSGVVGIVAARIVESYDRPAVILAGEDGIFHGSGRSVEGFNIFDAICHAASSTVGFGGHSAAAGVTVEKENLTVFDALLNEYAATVERVFPTLYIDCKLRPEIIGEALCHTIARLEPFGTGNPQPIFGLYAANIVGIDHLKGGKYIKLSVEKQGYTFSVLCFSYSVSTLPFALGDTVDVAFTPELNEFHGRRSVTLMQKQLRPHSLDEEAYFGSLCDFDDFVSGQITPSAAQKLLPERDDFVSIFTFIRCSTVAVTEEKLFFKFPKITPGKIKVILSALQELGLVEYKVSHEVAGYMLSGSNAHVSLDDAEIIIKLKNIINTGR